MSAEAKGYHSVPSHAGGLPPFCSSQRKCRTLENSGASPGRSLYPHGYLQGKGRQGSFPASERQNGWFWGPHDTRRGAKAQKVRLRCAQDQVPDVMKITYLSRSVVIVPLSASEGRREWFYGRVDDRNRGGVPVTTTHRACLIFLRASARQSPS
jgi:hypothetical protein